MELARAKELLTALADGIDPFTGEVFPEIISATSRIRSVRFTASYRRCLRNGRRHAAQCWSALEPKETVSLQAEFQMGKTTSEMARIHEEAAAPSRRSLPIWA